MIKGIQSIVRRKFIAEQQKQLNYSHIRANKYYLCARKQIAISTEQQNAFLSFMALNFIRSFPDDYESNPYSIRERIVDGKSFEQFIISEAAKHGYSFTSVLEMGITKGSMETVLRGFEFNKGALFNSEVYSQLRVKQASTFATSL